MRFFIDAIKVIVWLLGIFFLIQIIFISPFRDSYVAYKVSQFGHIEYAVVDSASVNTDYHSYDDYTVTSFLSLVDRKVNFNISHRSIKKLRKGDTIVLHVHQTDSQEPLTIYSEDENSSFWHLLYSNVNWFNFVINLIWIGYLLFVFFNRYIKLVLEIKTRLQKQKAVLSKTDYILDSLIVYAPVLIGLLTTLIMVKLVGNFLTNSNYLNSWVVALLIILTIVMAILYPYLYMVAIKRFKQSKQSVISTLKKLTSVFGIGNFLLILIQALLDDNPDNFNFSGFFKILINNYDNLLP